MPLGFARTLLCNLVRVKLSCYELEQCSLSVEDYLKAFMENEVKPLWPKGWMQTRCVCVFVCWRYLLMEKYPVIKIFGLFQDAF